MSLFVIYYCGRAFMASDHKFVGSDAKDMTWNGTVPQNEPRSCSCCINIYVDNNIQGVTSSILLGSKVVMGDPGVHLSLRKEHGTRCTWEGSKAGQVTLPARESLFVFYALLLCFVLVIFAISK
ncbi:hypothetical protein HPP92_005006 [Vanilla planifolia]|uniref:Uncharacterized protein n=1 Tax=Vanilla planifolia TaxID=51239 RepID=A0A835RJF9_VANPL|nr:hypothetical protein HPP92_005006 [Vanilla planifolia]